MTGLALVRAAEDQFDEAKRLYKQSLQLSSDPQIYVALGELYESQGQTEQAQRAYQFAELTWRHAQQTGDDEQGETSTVVAPNDDRRYTHSHRYPGAESRALAMFYADRARQPERSLELARRDLQSRQDIYSYDTLAWALYQNKRYDEAEIAMNRALRLGTRDAKLYFHAGMIASRRGDRTAAIKYLSQATQINPAFSLIHRATLRATLKTMQQQDAGNPP